MSIFCLGLSFFFRAFAFQSAPLRFEPRRYVLAVPQYFAAPQNFERIVGLGRGLLGLYWDAALNATEVFTGEI